MMVKVTSDFFSFWHKKSKDSAERDTRLKQLVFRVLSILLVENQKKQDF